MRKTKIIATIGPATDKEDVIEAIVESGVNVFRFNLKHNTIEWHVETIEKVRKAAQKKKANIAILVDIPDKSKARMIENADFMALSYLRNHEELVDLKMTLEKAGIKSKVIAKIENGEAIKDLKAITENCDGIMVARGDLGMEVPIEELAYWQKQIIKECRSNSIPVIVATQMLQSMVKNPTPTRAEATDVANAVFDGADALMLSEETAIGENPVKAACEMAKIIEFNEKIIEIKDVERNIDGPGELIIEAAANIIRNPKSQIKTAVVFSQSGRSVRILSSFHCHVPIIAVTNNKDILSILSLSYGVIPWFKEFESDRFVIDDPMFTEIKEVLELEDGSNALVIHGTNWLTSGATSDISLKTI